MQTTFLTEDQIWGGSALDVIKKYGTQTALTDLAIALGGYMGSGSTTSEGDKAGYVWSASASVNNVRVVRYGGGEDVLWTLIYGESPDAPLCHHPSHLKSARTQ